MSAAATVESNITSKVICPPDDALDLCAWIGIINLYVKCGLEPPSLDSMMDLWPRTDGKELTPAEQLGLLHELRFPGIVSFGIIPAGQTAKHVFPVLMSAGWELLVGVAFVDCISREGAFKLGDRELEGVSAYQTHGVVPISFDAGGMDVMIGWKEMPVGGVTWQTMPHRQWGQHPGTQMHGIMREFVMVFPYSKLKKQEGDLQR